MSGERPAFETNLPPERVREVVNALRRIYDPEIPINIYDLGLVRQVVLDGKALRVVMTLTALGCPLAGIIVEEVERALRSAVPEAEEVEVVIDLSRPWDPTQMTEEGRTLFRLMYGYDIAEQYAAARRGDAPA
ncbi:MAG: metal-sulfur cluster assembly factor [Thermoproteaceae archaeon]|nr:metal-sulfur cluster assembly factor [Thermoproteaceae archaeon]